MARLIDADALIAKQASIAKHFAKSDAQKALMGRVMYNTECAPTVDAVPVAHGRWYEIRDYSQAGLISFECSECGRLCITLYKYCPYCGAKMDGERRDEDA